MSNLTEELENWFKYRPLWLQDAARRLLTKGELEESDFEDLLKICKKEAGFEFEEEDLPVAKPISAGSFTQEEHASKVEICSISEIVGVNNLNPKQALTISDGLTVIYGQNGSGKSGYTRLLKHICGAKNRGELYPNAFEEKPANQSCNILYKVDNNNYELDWDATQGIHQYLSAVELYDSECALTYVKSENELAYEPFLLKFFTKLTIICDRLSDRLKHLLQSSVFLKPELPSQYKITEVYQWYNNISYSTTEEEVNTKCSWSDENQNFLDDLYERLRVSDPGVNASRIRSSKVQLDNLIRDFRKCQSNFSNEACTEYFELKEDYLSKQVAASEYAKSIFDNSPLSGIGENIWSLLWEQARAYSQQVTYPNTEFPHIGEDALCVLCQQPLSEAAKIRLAKFEKFVEERLELVAREAKGRLERAESIFNEIPSQDLITGVISGVSLEEQTSNKLLELRKNILQESQKIINLPIDKTSTLKMDFTILGELTSISEDLEIRAKQFEQDAQEENREQIKKEFLELEAKKWISQQKDTITAEIDSLSKAEIIRGAKPLVKTTALSNKKSELADKLISEAYIKRFENELCNLSAKRIKVKAEKTRSEKGRVYFCIKVEGNQSNIPADCILSEGELRIISLAAFLADVEGHSHKSTFIFDDPISSLDQDYEEKVAERLVELSKSRQVLVFTHRLSLMALLEEARKKQKLPPQIIIGLSKEYWGAGEPGLPPLSTQKCQAAINTLISKIQQGRKKLEEEGNESYEWWAKSMCSHIRITIEKIVEFDLLADVVQRFRRAINTQGKLHKVARVTPEDCEYIDDLMSKYSRYEHFQPNESPGKLPEPDEIEVDLNKLQEWRDEFTKR